MIPFWKKTDKGGKKTPPKPAIPRILVANRDIHITAEEDFSGHSIVIVRADAPYARTVRAFGGRVIVAKNTPEALELLRAGKVKEDSPRLRRAGEHDSLCQPQT